MKQQYLLHEALEYWARHQPEKTVVIAGGESYSYRELQNCSSTLAAALVARGLRRGDRVAVFMENSWQCAVAIYAVLKAGGVFVVINPQTKSEKLAFILNDCTVRHLLTEANLLPVIEESLPQFQSVTHIIVSGIDPVSEWCAGRAAKLESLEELLADKGEISRASIGIPLDLAALIYTSGSTGHPKGVMQTHQSMLFAANSIIEYLGMDSEEVVVNVLPLSFDYGLYQLLMSVQLGAMLVLERSFTYYLDVLTRVQEHRITTFPGVPTLFSMIIAAHDRNPLCYPGVKRITNTAATLPVDYIPRLQEIFPNALIFSMYGLTECKRVSYLEPDMLARKPTSVGKPIPGTEIFVLDSEGRIAAPGKRGILYVRGPHVMRGYWNRPEESAEMLVDGEITGEKMLRTGDWCHMDEEGYLYFDGRSDDIIKCRGEKISPVEIENALRSIPGVAEAVVIGIEDEVLGQAIRAYIVKDDGAELQTRDIKRELAAKLEGFMIPRDVVITESLPVNQNLKVCKRDLA